jgi:hypothetical protein
LLELKRGRKNQIRHQHGHLKWAELIDAEPKRPERFIASLRARFPANQGCGRDEVRNILVALPKVPKVRGASTSTLGLGLH